MIEHVNEFLAEQSQLSASRSHEIALEHRHAIIDVSHVFLALLEHPDETLVQLFEDMSLDIEYLKSETFKVIKHQARVPFWKSRKYQMYVTPLVKQSIEDAIALAKELNEEKASSAHIFWGVVNSSFKNQQNEIQRRMVQVFNDNNVLPEKILEILRKIKVNQNDK
jgi:ATP-dependent Clp protease ATP-binding subunit ClpA